MPSSSYSASSPKSRKLSPSSTTTNHHHHHHHTRSATATLDLLILVLVLFSGTFLLTSYLSYIFNSLSLLLPACLSLFHHFPLLYSLGFLLSFAIVLLSSFDLCSLLGLRRKCPNPNCKALKKALEFDLQLQTEDSLKSGPNEIDRLPWKGGSESNPDYECLRAELRKMAPPHGRAVLIFRSKCGCPVAKLVGWGPKKGRKHKKALTDVLANGDHH